MASTMNLSASHWDELTPSQISALSKSLCPLVECERRLRDDVYLLVDDALMWVRARLDGSVRVESVEALARFILKKKIQAEIRSRRRRALWEQGGLPQKVRSDGFVEDAPVADPRAVDPAREAELRATAEKIRSALTSEERLILDLAYQDEYNCQEIAEILGLATANAASARLMRANRKVRKLLAQRALT